MIFTKTMIKDDFTKTNSLEYEEDCGMDTDNDDGSSVGGTNEAKEESESINNTGSEENDGGTTSTSGNDLLCTQVFATQLHKPNREAKILETSIANLKKKLQTQSQANFPTSHSHLNRKHADAGSTSKKQEIGDHSQVPNPKALSISKEESPIENENYSMDCCDEGGQTAVERSLAAMTKSKYSSSSSNRLNEIDDDENNEGSKKDAFLDRIFGEAETDNSGSKNFDQYDATEAHETSSNPDSYVSSDMTISAALRRKRQRRNPVWPYFVVKDGMATCKHCDYSTKSVFSTNLKVHLRTHHHDLFEEVLKAEEEQQEQTTLQNSLVTTCATTTAVTVKTPYMHHVITTALPAIGRCSNIGSNINTGSSNYSSNTFSSTGSNLSSAAVLLGILNQTGGFQSGSVVTTTTSATAGITTASKKTRTLPTTPRSILNFPKAFSEPQTPLDYLKITPDLTRNLPDLLKVISETTVKSAAKVPLNQTKTHLPGDNERLKTFHNISQNSLSPYNITHASDRTDKTTPLVSSQSAIGLKRRRLRRHPVWRFFKDVGDGSKTVKCVNCPFSTSSPFSTNLKMHLKAHHKSDYRLILVLESRQRLEEGISPVPDSVHSPSSPLKISSNDDANVSSADEEVEAKKRSLSTGTFEDESFTSMTSTERVKAMIEMAAASQTQSVDVQYPNIDYAAIGNTNRTSSFDSDESSGLVDTGLLMRLGLSNSDLLPSSKTPLQNKFVNTQSVGSGNVRSHPGSAHISTALDTTKSVRTISKRLPTGEVVKVRQTRKNVENPVTNVTITSAAATATINTTKPIVPSRDLTTKSTTDEQLDVIKLAKDIALAKFLIKVNAFQLLDLPEFKQLVNILDPTYQMPPCGYLKRLLENKAGDHNLSSEHFFDIVQEQKE